MAIERVRLLLVYIIFQASRMRKFVIVASLFMAAAMLCILMIRLSYNESQKNTTALKLAIKFDEKEIPKYFMPSMNKQDRIAYTRLVKLSLQKDLTALKKLINFWCGGGSYCYGHGILVVKIVGQIGEEPFIAIIPDLDEQEREWLKFLLEVGLEYRALDKHQVFDKLDLQFPKLDRALNYYTKNPLCVPPLNRLSLC